MRNHKNSFAHTPDQVTACEMATVHHVIPAREMVAITAKLSSFNGLQKD